MQGRICQDVGFTIFLHVLRNAIKQKHHPLAIHVPPQLSTHGISGGGGGGV